MTEFVILDASLFFGVRIKFQLVHRYLIETHPLYAAGVVEYVRKADKGFSRYTKEDVITDLITDGGCGRSSEEKEQANKRKRKAKDMQCADCISELDFKKENGQWYACSDESAFSTFARIPVPEWSDLDMDFEHCRSNEPDRRGKLLLGKRISIYASGAPVTHRSDNSELDQVAKQLAALSAMYPLVIKFYSV